MATQKSRGRTKRPTPQLQSFDALLINAGMKPGPFLSALRKDLARTADPVRAANNLHRFLTSGFPSPILHDFQRHHILQQIALELFSQSQYLADGLVRDPGLFRWLTSTPALKVAKSKTDFLEEARTTVKLFSRLDRKLDALKRFHRREILRIGAREILKEADVTTITRELSDLADAVVETVLQLGQQELAVRTGATFGNTLVVIGLGKLGGRELNFSSDIDLLFLYERDAEFDAPQERIRTFHDYYNRLAEFIVRKLTEFTGEGYLYRVDMRLRPEGSSGPLALSVAGSLQYYEIRGVTWERQMLVKARPIAGNIETGNAWVEAVRPFVYPRTFLQSPLDEIVAMKSRIEEQTDARMNLKLGEGGIRDIEFIVQGLQLLNGGMNERLREPNTLNILDVLADEKKLPKNDARLLAEAYAFFRMVEHRLQLLHGAQTHSLPSTRAESEILARRLSFPAERVFHRTVEKYRRSVRAIFNRVFLKPAGLVKPRGSPASPVRFLDREKATRNLGRLLAAVPSLELPSESHRFLSVLRGTGAADWCLDALATLADALPIRRALGQAWKNEELMKLVVLLGARSRVTSELLAREPLLFETLMGQPDEIFKPDWAWRFLRTHDRQKFKLYNEQKALITFLAGQQDHQAMMEQLSALAEAIVVETCSEIFGENGFCLLALGKLGGREISFGSDLDLILLYDGEALDPPSAERAAKSLRERFASQGLYEMDFQLRPEGKSAPLAAEIGYYQEYLKTRASLWERQSLVKGRVLFGSENIRQRTHSIIEDFVYVSPFPSGWVEKVVQMRERIEKERSGTEGMSLKTGYGGLMDLEFALQMLQMHFGRDKVDLRNQSTFALLRFLQENENVPGVNFAEFERNMKFFRFLETFIRLNGIAGEFTLPSEPARLQAIAAAAGKPSGTMLKKSLAAMTQRNRKILTRVVERCSS